MAVCFMPGSWDSDLLVNAKLYLAVHAPYRVARASYQFESVVPVLLFLFLFPVKSFYCFFFLIP